MNHTRTCREEMSRNVEKCFTNEHAFFILCVTRFVAISSRYKNLWDFVILWELFKKRFHELISQIDNIFLLNLKYVFLRHVNASYTYSEHTIITAKTLFWYILG